MVIYFSGIGNSKYIADRIAASLQEKTALYERTDQIGQYQVC